MACIDERVRGERGKEGKELCFSIRSDVRSKAEVGKGEEKEKGKCGIIIIKHGCWQF